jgi:adenylate cyclase
MKDDAIERLAAWVIERGLDGASETELMQGLCEGCCEAGLPLSRALTIIDTLHPTHEGRAFRWRNDGVEESAVIEYGRTNEGEAAENWRRSAFYHLLTSGEDELRRRLAGGEPVEFAQLQTMQAEGVTDYVALIHRFPGSGSMGEMDCFYSHWTTRQPDGFDERQVAALRKLLPPLALAIKCASLARIAETLVEVYLGRDAGRRVLSGRIQRGVADRIGAVLWFSDLRGYTTISDAAAPDEIIPLLNDYADAVISAVHDAGGDVLKLMGDGVLAIFNADEPANACLGALRAEADLRLRLRTLNARRAAEGRPVTSAYLGLHIGDVFYGNIGSQDRLDFTVVGPAVNEVSRIASMCRSVDRGVVTSSDFAAAVPEAERVNLVSVGRYALRGVGRAQELFTIDPEVLIANGDLA